MRGQQNVKTHKFSARGM